MDTKWTELITSQLKYGCINSSRVVRFTQYYLCTSRSPYSRFYRLVNTSNGGDNPMRQLLLSDGGLSLDPANHNLGVGTPRAQSTDT